MKTLTACLITDIPESVISCASVGTMYGSTVWKRQVVATIKSYKKQMRHPVSEDWLQRMQMELVGHERLLAFMEKYGLDVAFRDREEDE